MLAWSQNARVVRPRDRKTRQVDLLLPRTNGSCCKFLFVLNFSKPIRFKRLVPNFRFTILLLEASDSSLTEGDFGDTPSFRDVTERQFNNKIPPYKFLRRLVQSGNW